MVQGREPLQDPGADGAQDQDRGQVGISHEGPAQEPARLVGPVDVSRHHHHQVVGQREAGVLTPPPVEAQGHIKTCRGQEVLLL